MKRMMSHSVLAAALCAPLVSAPAAAQALSENPERSLLEVAPNLYRIQDDEHFGLLLITGEGAIVADPLNLPAAEWLRKEIDERFGVPVRYVIYSHHHVDHVSGAQAWPDAVVVAHEAAIAALTPPAQGAPPSRAFAAADANGDGRIQRDEAPPNIAARFHIVDTDGDGALSAREWFEAQQGATSVFGGVRMPDQTWSGADHVIALGGHTVRMVHVEALHASDSALIVFENQRTMLVSDIINTRRMPYVTPTGFSEADIDLITDTALAQDVDVVVPGHGEIGTLEDVEAHRRYHRDIVAAARKGIAEGLSLEEIQAGFPLEGPYASWTASERHEQNIAGAHGYVMRLSSQ